MTLVQCLQGVVRETLAVRWLVPAHVAMGLGLTAFMAVLQGEFDPRMLWGLAIMLANIPTMALLLGLARWVGLTGRT